MKVSYTSTLTPDNSLAVKKTEDLNAKTLLCMFLAQSQVLDDFFAETEAYKDYFATIEKYSDIERKLYSKFESLPSAVCDSLIEFLAQSPNIHITID